MLNLDHLMKVEEIITHKSCSDGTAAAMIASNVFSALGMKFTVRFLQYGEEHENLEPHEHQLFLDITPPISRWEEWKKYNPIILDHHISAYEVTRDLGGIYGDGDESGATLAFKFIMKAVSDWSEEVKFSQPLITSNNWGWFASLIAMHDTWSKHPDILLAHGMSKGLGFYDPYSAIEMARNDEVDFSKIQDIGDSLYSKLIKKAKVYASSAYITNVTNVKSNAGKSYRVGFFNCSEKATSEACDILLQEGCDLSVSYFLIYETERMNMIVSLRSHKDGIAVNKIAESFKGGGHHSAAGFKLVTWEIKDMILSVLSSVQEM